MADIQVQGPDGVTLSFPEGTGRDVMKAAMAKRYPKENAPRETKNMQQDEPTEEAVPWYTPITSLPENAIGVASGLYNAVRHPFDTVNGVAELAAGGILNGASYVAPDAVKNWANSHPADSRAMQNASMAGAGIKESFRSPTKAWNTIATHPIDTMMMLVPGLGQTGKLSKLAGMERTSQGLASASQIVNPINFFTKTPQVMSALAREIAGGLTGAGGASLKEAFTAGKKGGDYGDAFRDSMRGNVAQDEVVSQAKDALGRISDKTSNEYMRGMESVRADKSPIDMSPIDRAYIDVTKSLFEGPVQKGDRATFKTLQDIGKYIDTARNDPTPINLDAVKQRIYNEAPNFTQEVGQQGRVNTTMANAIKGAIIEQRPEYKGVMKSYENSKGIQKEISKSLSLGRNATSDSALRKLQSIFRNNANTNYGSRIDSAKILEEAGGKNIMPALAGQQLNSFIPRGLSKYMVGSSALGAALASPQAAMMAAPLLAASSPRLMGEISHFMGRASGKVSKANQMGKEELLKYLIGARAMSSASQD